MTDITIPAAALEAGARAAYYAFTEINIGDREDRWERLLPRFRAEYREQARAAILAALKAWPNQHVIADDVVYIMHALVLPLTEKPNAEA